MMLSLVFSPDTVSTATAMTELARGWRSLGHEVTVLTSMPHYNPSQEVMRNPNYRARLPTLFTDAMENGIRVLRVYMSLKRQRVWLRILDYIWFQTLTTIVAPFKIGRQDVIFVPSPPITLGISGYILSLILRAKLIYDVRELWPDTPVQMGLLKNGLLVRLMYAVEHFVYSKSAAITSIARNFNDNLVRRGVPKDKVNWTPYPVDVERLAPGCKLNSFSRAHGLEDKFVVLYAGNIGLTQGLEILIDVAAAFKNDREVVFLVIGDGAERSRFEQSLQDSGLQNLKFLPFQPSACVPDIYATADVCVIPMRFGFSYSTLPSKTYSAMAAGKPIVSACEPDTESGLLLRESNCGIVVPPESVTEMVEAIRRIRDFPDLARTMGQNGRKWLVEHYRRDIGIAAYDQVFRKVLNLDRHRVSS